MEVAIAKYLRECRGSDGLSAIHIRVCWLGRKVRFTTREKINPDHWNAENQIIKKSAVKEVGRSVVNRLAIYTNQLEAYFERRETVPSVAEVQAEIKRIRIEELGELPKSVVVEPPKLAQTTLKEFLETYIKELPGGLSSSTERHLSAIIDHLDSFQLGLNWEGLKINTLNQFKAYLSKEINLSDNTVSAYFGSFRGALKYALVMGLPVPNDYTIISTTTVPVIRPALTMAHLKRDLAEILQAADPLLLEESLLSKLTRLLSAASRK